jgi:methylenetetrahydrofolate reductase (NADH)
MSVSFEFFPPRTPEAEDRWWTAIERLAALDPTFVSVTCGAGGSGVEKTLESLRAMTARTDLRLAGHLTCIGRSRQEVDAAIAAYWDTGVRQILALRGDMPEGVPYEPHSDGYASSVELIEAVQRVAPFEISVAAYPQRHPDSISPTKDLEWLARKVDAGAARAITQFCFDTDQILRLRDAIDFAGIEVNLVPGILSATNFKSVSRMATKCGVELPSWLLARFAGLEDDRETRMALAAIVAAEQVDRLSREGFEEFHFFTMNNYDVVPAICRLIDVGAAQPEVSVT